MTTTIQLPPRAPRKLRKQESIRFVVKWIVSDTMYFQWFKRDSAACAFLNRLVVDQTVEARILMK